MRKRGITLLEVMVVTICMAVILGASSSAVFTAMKHTNEVKASRAVYDRNAQFEDKLRRVLQNAYLSSVTTDTNSYFYGGQNVLDVSSGQQGDPNQLIFTAISPRVPSELIESKDDFETLNKTYGPEGGMTEYSISLTAIGQATVDQALFIRHQTPADGDPSQGGMEMVLDPDVDTISYEFYDGTEWQTTWDTTQMTPPRLPSAVRITYRRKNDSTDRLFIVRLIHSDVTPDNPVTQTVTQ